MKIRPDVMINIPIADAAHWPLRTTGCEMDGVQPSVIYRTRHGTGLPSAPYSYGGRDNYNNNCTMNTTNFKTVHDVTRLPGVWAHFNEFFDAELT